METLMFVVLIGMFNARARRQNTRAHLFFTQIVYAPSINMQQHSEEPKVKGVHFFFLLAHFVGLREFI